MADGFSARLDGVDDVLAYYAELKGVPLADVLRHAAKDIAYAAYKATPSAMARGRSSFAMLPGRGKKRGKSVIINLEAEAAREASRAHRPFKDRKKRWKKGGHLARLNKYRLASPARGFARSLFIPLFKQMGFKTQKPRASDASAYEKFSRGFSVFASPASPYADGFKEGVETFRARNMRPSSVFSSAEAPASGGEAPRFGFSISQPALTSPAHASWASDALQAGYDRAASIIARDMAKILRSPRPSQEKPDTL